MEQQRVEKAEPATLEGVTGSKSTKAAESSATSTYSESAAGQGQNAPTGRKMRPSDAKSVLLDSGDPDSGGGAARQPAILTAGLGVKSDSDGDSIRDGLRVFIDKLTMTIPMPSAGSSSERNRAWHRALKAVLNDQGAIERSPTLRYRSHCLYAMDFDLQWANGDTKGDSLRIEYNPSHPDCNPFALVSVLALFPVTYLARAAVTRLDWAIDYGDKLEPSMFYVERVQSYGTRGGRGGMETHYIGSPDSSRMFRIYNKQLEREKATREAVPGPWWRIESQSRERVDLKSLATKNPFDGLRYYRFAPGVPGKYWQAYAEKYGLQCFRGDWSKNDWRRKVQPTMTDRTSELPGGGPSKVWMQTGLDEWRAVVWRWLDVFEDAAHHYDHLRQQRVVA